MTQENSNTRRDFIKKSTLGAATLSLGGLSLSPKSYAQVRGSNERVRVAMIGMKRRGKPLTESISKLRNVEMTYLCEIDSKQMEDGLKHCQEHLGYKPKTEIDLRNVIERNDVDAVFLAIPDHWHAAATWMALQAGKHVYVEKPCSHNPHESELLVKYQKRYDKVVQIGTQQRSSVETREIVNEIHNGIIGDTYMAITFYSNRRGGLPQAKVTTPPEWLYWELYQGPAPRRPYMNVLEDYNWHWFWHWGTAETGNNATHEIDVARWAMDVKYPQAVYSNAGKYHFKDDPWEMYDTMDVTFEYPGNRYIKWDGKSRNAYSTYGSGRGTIIYGSEGSVYVDRGGYRLYDRRGEEIRSNMSGGSEGGVALGGGGDMTTMHVSNFIEAIRSGEKQNGPIDEGAISTDLTHFANISYRTGNQRLEIDPVTGRFKDWSVMREFWGREYERGFEPPV